VLRAQTTLPIGVGFGIKDAASALAIARAADAVVIGSRLIQVCGDAPTGQAAQHAHDFLAPIRAALDARNTESTEPAQGVRA
jgi:tryptophan synthase alpha chain